MVQVDHKVTKPHKKEHEPERGTRKLVPLIRNMQHINRLVHLRLLSALRHFPPHHFLLLVYHLYKVVIIFLIIGPQVKNQFIS